MVPLGKLDIGRYAPKAPAGALGVDYGDFFPRDGEEDVGFVNIRHIGAIFPYLFLQFLSSFFYFKCVLVLLKLGEGECRNGWSKLGPIHLAGLPDSAWIVATSLTAPRCGS